MLRIQQIVWVCLIHWEIVALLGHEWLNLISVAFIHISSTAIWIVSCDVEKKNSSDATILQWKKTFQFLVGCMLLSYLFAFFHVYYSQAWAFWNRLTMPLQMDSVSIISIVHKKCEFFFFKFTHEIFHLVFCRFNISCNAACRWPNYMIYLNRCNFISTSIHFPCINWSVHIAYSDGSERKKWNKLNPFPTIWDAIFLLNISNTNKLIFWI